MQFDDETIDLVKAISSKESNGGKNMVSKLSQQEGSFGSMQFLKPTFDSYAKKYLGGKALDGRPLDINDQSHQRLVAAAYVQNKRDQKKADGAPRYTAGDIAASWNAGEGRITSWQNMAGTNSYGNKFDVPAYVVDVGKRYQEIKNQRLGIVSQDPNAPKEWEPNVLSNTVGSLIQAPADLGDVAAKYGGATVAYGIDKLTGSNTFNSYQDALEKSDPNNQAGNMYAPNIANQMQGQEGTTANITTAEGLRKVGGDVLQTGALVLPGNLGKLGLVKSGAAAGSVYGFGQANSENKDLGGTLLSTGLGAAAGAGGGAVFKYGMSGLNKLGLGLTEKAMNKAINKAGGLRAEGKFNDAIKYEASKEYQAVLKRAGLDTPEGMAKGQAEQIANFRERAPEVLSFSKQKDLLTASDNSIKIALSNLQNVGDKGFKTAENVVGLETKAGEMAQKAQDLAKVIGEQFKLSDKSLSVENFKQNIIKKLRSEVNPNEESFINFVTKQLDNLKTKPGNSFENLTALKTKLNASYGDELYDSKRFLADEIRALINRLDDNVPGVKEYKLYSKTYGDTQDAIKILAGLNNKGDKMSAGMLANFGGLLASGGAYNPIMYGLGSKATEKLAQTANKYKTSKMFKSAAIRSQEHPLDVAMRSIDEAMTRISGNNATTKEAVATAQNLAKYETSKEVSKANFSSLNKILLKTERKLNANEEVTAQDLNYITKLLTKNKDNPLAGTLDSRVSKVLNKTEKQKSFLDKLKADKAEMSYTPDSKLPTIDAGLDKGPVANQKAETAKEKMIRTSKGLSKILGIAGTAGLASQLGTQEANAMQKGTPSEEPANKEEPIILSKNQIENVKNAIADKESGGVKNPYEATNTQQSAHGTDRGRFQFSDTLRKELTELYFGKEILPKDFSPKVQEDLMTKHVEELLKNGFNIKQIFQIHRKGLRGMSSSTAKEYGEQRLKRYEELEKKNTAKNLIETLKKGIKSGAVEKLN